MVDSFSPCLPVASACSLLFLCNTLKKIQVIDPNDAAELRAALQSCWNSVTFTIYRF